MTDLLTRAIELNRAGLACIPIIPGTKRPACKIKPFFENGPSGAQLPLLFNERVEIAVLGGKPSERLAIIDCDNMPTAERMLAALDRPNTWLVKTYRGMHIYTRTPVAVRSTRGDGFDLQAQAKYCLAPGSRHPKGVTYEFIQKPERIVELPSLDAIPGLALLPAATRPNDLPRHAWRLLTDATAWHEYTSRSEAECSAILSLINNGCDYARVLIIFSQHAHPDTHFQNLIRDRGVRHAEEWLRRVYNDTVEFAHTHHSPELQMILHGRQWVEQQTWQGQAGAYNRAVLLGHLAIAERAGRLTYQASVRDLAEQAGVSIKAVSKANQRLVKLSLIELVKAAYGTLAAMWRLGVFGWTKGNTPSSPSVGECVLLSKREIGHDVFRWAGFGKGAGQVWAKLERAEQPLTVQQIAEQTGRSAKTVYRILARFQGLGMVECVPDGANPNQIAWGCAPEVNLDEMARKIGVAGIGARQRAEHIRERAAHRRAMQGDSQ